MQLVLHLYDGQARKREVGGRDYSIRKKRLLVGNFKF